MLIFRNMFKQFFFTNLNFSAYFYMFRFLFPRFSKYRNSPKCFNYCYTLLYAKTVSGINVDDKYIKMGFTLRFLLYKMSKSYWNSNDVNCNELFQ